ncbi:spermidine/putrescine ABC transporter permease [Thalassospira mesophila]|uniref:Spermidine/putrescine ABC transporter permease n=1 Tax=Thalassospira mesophila TaxID=1293891 RepID=A0A1Y2L323_9PROT|nr:spermidine/putrescine ABC transporter permease [Thalassospira mesophila]
MALAIFVFALIIFGPLTNMLLWAVTERWYFPHTFPLQYGFEFWHRVFKPTGNAVESLQYSLMIAVFTVMFCLSLAVPAGYALARLRLPARALILLLFLVPQAFPNIPVYINIARLFYQFGWHGTVPAVVLVHTLHGMVYAVWIATAAFSAVDPECEAAARDIGAGPIRTFFTISFPSAFPGLVASGIFVFLESLDEFTGTYFVGAPEITTLPMLMFRAGMEGNYQVASITALLLLVPSVLFMFVVERFLRADVLAGVGR